MTPTTDHWVNRARDISDFNLTMTVQEQVYQYMSAIISSLLFNDLYAATYVHYMNEEDSATIRVSIVCLKPKQRNLFHLESASNQKNSSTQTFRNSWETATRESLTKDSGILADKHSIGEQNKSYIPADFSKVAAKYEEIEKQGVRGKDCATERMKY